MQKFKEINIFNLVWIFMFGSLLGWGIELIWYKVRWGYFLYNQGLVIGPFSQVYGFGAVILVLICILLKNRSKLLVFVTGFIVFGVFEYLCGLYAEVFLDAFCWNYSNVGFNFTIGKYVYLPYCAVWGLLSLIWFTWVQKPLLKLLEKFNNKKMRIFTYVLFVFLIFNFALSSFAVSRRVERIDNIPASNKFEEMIDKVFDDEYMQKYMPKVRKAK